MLNHTRKRGSGNPIVEVLNPCSRLCDAKDLLHMELLKNQATSTTSKGVSIGIIREPKTGQATLSSRHIGTRGLASGNSLE